MIILGTNSIKDTGFDVDNSLRFNSGSTDNLTRTFGTPTNNKKWTYSFWMKHCDDAGVLLNTGADTGYMYFRGAGANPVPYGFSIEQYVGGFQYKFIPSETFRDYTVWQHIVIAFDTTQSSASNRVKIYKNGSQITSFNSADYPSQNLDTQVNSAVAHKIGGFASGANYDGYLCEVVFIDGQQLDPTSFGKSDSGTWKPIDPSGLTFGNNGFYLDFKDSSALGNDANGSNNFTVNNLTAIDQSTDTCTNNFATLNPSNTDGGTFSEGNLQHTRNSAGYRHAISSIGVSSGKWYVEIKSPDVENIGVGVINGATSSNLNMSGSEQFLGQHSYDAGYFFNGILYVGNSSQSGSWTAYGSNDIIGIALDADNGFVYFSKNGTFVNSGNPASGASGTGGYALSGIGGSGTYFIGVSTGNNSEHYVNFGNPIFSISSGNQDADGFGNMEYAFPSGYFCINQKNIAEYG